MSVNLEKALAAVGPRLRALRKQRHLTLEQVAELAGTSTSTLSRLESGQRRPTLQLLLPIAEAYRVPLDELVGAPPTGDPRIHPKPVVRNGSTWVPLHRVAGGVNAFKQILPVDPDPGRPMEQQSHEGFEWIFVLSGKLRLSLDHESFHLGQGEAAEFDTRKAHAVVNAGDRPAELIIIFGQQGQRVHMLSTDDS